MRAARTIFVHFTNPRADRPEAIVFQDDHAPPTPTEQWQAGDAVEIGPHAVEVAEGREGTFNVLIGLIMFGVALDIRVDDFKRVARDPRGPLIGLAAQFLLLPAMTFVLVLVLEPLPSIGLGMMMVASCPGGNFSNFLTHHAKANAALSVIAIDSTLSMPFSSQLRTPMAFIIPISCRRE